MLDVVDEYFDGVLIFCGIRCTPLGEDEVFELSDVDVEYWFLRGGVVPVLIPGLTLSVAVTSLLLH